MTTVDDGLQSALSATDPTRTDLPPAKGSKRHTSILEAAMKSQTAESGRELGRREQPKVRHWPVGRTLLGAAAAVAVLAAVTFGLLQPGHEASATAAVMAAAAKTGDSLTLRATLVVERADGTSASTQAEMNGGDVHIVTEQKSKGGETLHEAITVVGDTIWETSGDRTRSSAVGAGDRLVAFSDACETVIAAALESGQVSDEGTQKIRQVEAQHYRIVMDPAAREALAKLSPGALAYFELEYPEDVSAIDVWVADGLVHRIQVEGQRADSTTDFYDFGADISIQPPPTE